jgi:hypothetical protein
MCLFFAFDGVREQSAVENICAKRGEVIRRWEIWKMEGFSICTLNLIFLWLSNHGGSDRQFM